jgi:hypothetical protein
MNLAVASWLTGPTSPVTTALKERSRDPHDLDEREAIRNDWYCVYDN